MPFHIRNIRNIKYIDTTDDDTSNTWSLNNVTSSGDRLYITNFGNCGNNSENFEYIEDDGQCTGNILLKGNGTHYEITFYCTQMVYYSSTGVQRVSNLPNLYIYFAKNNGGNATNQGSQYKEGCKSDNPDCIVYSQFITDTISTDNTTLHFKLENTQKLKGDEYCSFGGYFTVEPVTVWH